MARGFASFVLFFARRDRKLLFVREFKNYKKPGPPRVIYYKVPGGRHDPVQFPDESPVECAIRRFFGETGIRLTADELREFVVVPVEARGDKEAHDKYFYGVCRDVLPELPPFGDRYNEVAAHTPDAFAMMKEDGEFHPEHVEVTAQFLASVEESLTNK